MSHFQPNTRILGSRLPAAGMVSSPMTFPALLSCQIIRPQGLVLHPYLPLHAPRLLLLCPWHGNINIGKQRRLQVQSLSFHITHSRHHPYGYTKEINKHIDTNLPRSKCPQITIKIMGVHKNLLPFPCSCLVLSCKG